MSAFGIRRDDSSFNRFKVVASQNQDIPMTDPSRPGDDRIDTSSAASGASRWAERLEEDVPVVASRARLIILHYVMIRYIMSYYVRV